MLNEIFDLFAALDADEHQLDFPHIYASAKQGWAVRELDDEREDLAPLFDLIVRTCRRPWPTRTGRSGCWRPRSRPTPISAAC